MSKVNPRILIVDDDKDLCEILSYFIKREGFKALTAYDGKSALEIIHGEKPDMVLLDMKMPGMDGMEVLNRVKGLDWELPVVFISAYADIPGAVEAMKAGAHDYLSKPFHNHEVLGVVQRVLDEQSFKRKFRQSSNQLPRDGFLREMMGPSDVIGQLISDVNHVAVTNFSVIIMGETGSGKELVARAIHQASPRSIASFIPLDCGAIPETLLESELFGHEKGAFTGAELKKPGKFEAAQGGTLFLDEIGNMPLGSQAKLLRVLQEKKVYRVGGTRPVKVDVRLLAASNQDIDELAVSGSFRRDLFFRLNEFNIKVSPLRERKEDIPYLAKRFLEITNGELGKNVRGFTEFGIEALLAYDWPGNVRQLRSTIRRAVLLAEDLITERHLDLKRVPVPGLAFTPRVKGTPWKGYSLKEIVHRSTTAVEREVLVEVLKRTGGNKAKAARLLQIDYKTMHTKTKQLGISIDGGELG